MWLWKEVGMAMEGVGVAMEGVGVVMKRSGCGYERVLLRDLCGDGNSLDLCYGHGCNPCGKEGGPS